MGWFGQSEREYHERRARELRNSKSDGVKGAIVFIFFGALALSTCDKKSDGAEISGKGNGLDWNEAAVPTITASAISKLSESEMWHLVRVDNTQLAAFFKALNPQQLRAFEDKLKSYISALPEAETAPSRTTLELINQESQSRNGAEWQSAGLKAASLASR